MSNTTTSNRTASKTYAIEDCHGNPLADGIPASKIAETGQQLANEHGQVVAYNEAAHADAPPAFMFYGEADDD